MVQNFEKCPGCGAQIVATRGPVHPYMTSSPACWMHFGQLLAYEYSDPTLMRAHRLSVDTYAVQHPGDGVDRRAIQSVGLHLARLLVQLETPRGPMETNDVMLGFAARKASLVWLHPPARFGMTIADVIGDAGQDTHVQRVEEWALSTWNDWKDHHRYIRNWVARA